MLKREKLSVAGYTGNFDDQYDDNVIIDIALRQGFVSWQTLRRFQTAAQYPMMHRNMSASMMMLTYK